MNLLEQETEIRFNTIAFTAGKEAIRAVREEGYLLVPIAVKNSTNFEIFGLHRGGSAFLGCAE